MRLEEKARMKNLTLIASVTSVAVARAIGDVVAQSIKRVRR